MNMSFTRLAPLALVVGLVTPAQALAQLDPLLFLKTASGSTNDLTTSATLRPNVIVAVDTSQRMQKDSHGTYYDPGTYTMTGATYEVALGLLSGEALKTYRRTYTNLRHVDPATHDGAKFLAGEITAVGDQESGYTTFFEHTRLALARRSITRAILDNTSSARFALMRTRQGSVTLPATGNATPLLSEAPSQQSATDAPPNKWNITRTTVSSNNSWQTTTGLLTAATASGANTTIMTTLGKDIGTAGALLPGGNDDVNVVDSPVGLMLDDARTHAASLITTDAGLNGCRNTIVVLIVGGGEGTISPQDLAAKAATFLNVNTRRVPVYVVALFPEAGERDSLEAIATASGGQYFEVTTAMVDAISLGDPVPEIVRAINTAVQHAYVPSTTFNTAPSGAHPFGLPSEWQVTSPIVGTVNLRGASKIGSSGSPELLPDSETYIFTGTTEIPQRSNMLVTAAFELPGFTGQLRAFRTYKPIADSTKPSGYRFSQDGSRLWVSSVPAAGSRNIYTILPGTTTMIPFDAAHVADLQPHLRVSDPEVLIDYVRAMSLGAIVGSTPAFLDIPSLDPPPDADYPGFREANKFRRALIFVGANDGMLHAFDARTGIEVWAFIPYNLLPKLRALRFGESLDNFSYFVDSSPKVADVKVGGAWRTFLFFGQGPGGTFYNTLDVTLEDLADSVDQTSTNDSALLSYFSSANRIPWKWSFPQNTSFDATLTPYGELSATTATAVEKTIGETWSDPAIGQLQDEGGPFVMVTGSGFLKYSTQSTRRAGVTRAGTTFYVLDVGTGDVLGTPRDVGADSYAETLNDCRAIDDCRKMKNALQMDPVATGPADLRFITKVYIGDLDGKVWRFNLSLSGSTVSVSTPTQLYDAGADYPLFSSMATVNVGSSNQYIFIGTGSDLQPTNSVNHSYSLIVLLDSGATATKTAEILLERTDSPPTTGGDEKVTSFPAVAGDIVFFTTTTYSPTTPCTPYSANLYAFTFIGGPAYDTNGDGSLSTSSSSGGGKKSGGGSTSADSQKVFSAAGVRATAPFIVDQHLVFSAGGSIQMFGDPNDFNNGIGQAGVRILSWRQVR
jgi:hypothetical protein